MPTPVHNQECACGHRRRAHRGTHVLDPCMAKGCHCQGFKVSLPVSVLHEQMRDREFDINPYGYGR